MNDKSQVVKELEDLIILAESSTSTIDTLFTDLDKCRSRKLMYYNSCFISILFEVILVKILVDINFIGKNSELYILLFTILFFILLIACFMANKSLSMKAKRIYREIKIEQDVHNKLISIIEDQLRRIKMYDCLSQVALATMEIRIRRLDRTDIPKWQ